MGQGSCWSICFEFLAQDPFIAFVPLPGPPPTASNEKKKLSPMSLTFLFDCELALEKLYRTIFNEEGVLKLILSFVIKL